MITADGTYWCSRSATEVPPVRRTPWHPKVSVAIWGHFRSELAGFVVRGGPLEACVSQTLGGPGPTTASGSRSCVVITATDTGVTTVGCGTWSQ
jgi:hypothetical protein